MKRKMVFAVLVVNILLFVCVLLHFGVRAVVADDGSGRIVVARVESRVLPPEARILSPLPGAEISAAQVILEVEFRVGADAPLTDVDIRINGRPQDGVSELVRGGAAVSTREAGRFQTWRIPLDLAEVSGDEAFIMVQGINRQGYGPPADVTVRLSSRQFQEFVVAPKLYLLALGVSSHRDKTLDLRYPAKDAGDVAAFFQRQAGGLYREVEARVITDSEATLSALRDGLFWLEEQVTANDTAMIFIAGHSINDNTGLLHFASYDLDVTALRRTGLASADILGTIGYLQGRVVYYVDACHSGNLDLAKHNIAEADINRHAQDLVAAGAVVFSSATGSRCALESPQWGNGAFALALIEGLSGKADHNGDGTVSVNELHTHLSKRVGILTSNQQAPLMQKPDSALDFPLAAVN